MSKRQTVRCVFTLKDGTKCGRRSKDLVTQLCSVHGQNKIPVESQFQPKDVDPLTVVQRLMRSRDEGTRLRAAESYLKLLERQSSAPSTSAGSLDLKLLTNSERTALEAIFSAYKDLLRRIWQRCPDAVVGEHADAFAREQAHAELERQQLEKQKKEQTREPVQQRDQPAGTAAEASVASSVAAAADAADQSPEVRPERRSLPPHLYSAVGLYTVGDVVTHDLGDLHAQKILSGEIPFEEAEAAQRAANKHVIQFADAVRIKKAKEQNR